MTAPESKEAEEEHAELNRAIQQSQLRKDTGTIGGDGADLEALHVLGALRDGRRQPLVGVLGVEAAAGLPGVGFDAMSHVVWKLGDIQVPDKPELTELEDGAYKRAYRFGPANEPRRHLLEIVVADNAIRSFHLSDGDIEKQLPSDPGELPLTLLDAYETTDGAILATGNGLKRGSKGAMRYHLTGLKADAGGRLRFKVELTTKNVRAEGDGVSIEPVLISDEPGLKGLTQFVGQVDLDTSEPGYYLASITVTDLESDATVSYSQPFEVSK